MTVHVWCNCVHSNTAKALVQVLSYLFLPGESSVLCVALRSLACSESKHTSVKVLACPTSGQPLRFYVDSMFQLYRDLVLSHSCTHTLSNTPTPLFQTAV